MTKSIVIQNLKCGGCANTISKQLGQLKDVSSVAVEVDSGTVKIEYSLNETFEQVIKKLKKLGYPSVSQENGIGSVARSFISCGIGRFSKYS